MIKLFKKGNLRILSVCMAVLAMTLSICSSYKSASAETIIIRTINFDESFTTKSIPDGKGLQLDADSISFYAECEGNKTDLLTAYIIDLTHDDLYSDDFSFPANKSVTTFPGIFPAGFYKIYFVGSSDVVKTLVQIDFGKFVD